MSDIYVIRAILDAEDDVIRDVAIQAEANLYDLHKLLVEAFDLHKGEMSSFFKSNSEWDQGEEISMMDFDPATGENSLDKMVISEAFTDKGSKMLFVYDYLALWTFYLEVLDLRDALPDASYPTVVGSVGTLPKEAPQKEMKAESDGFDDLGMDEDIEQSENDDDLWL